MANTPIIWVLIASLGALWATVVPRIPKAVRPALAAFPSAIVFFWALSLTARTAQGEVISGEIPWIPELGLGLDWRLDGLSLLFVLLASGIGALVMAYAVGYQGEKPGTAKLIALLHLFQAAMLGTLTSDNAFGLFLFWELTGVFSYLLIGTKNEDKAARSAAQRAFLVTGVGGLALLGGLVLLSLHFGTARLSEWNAVLLEASPMTTGATVLVLLGALTKSAQFPFHFWLPGAMAAPTPVSAYLHSATMVKLGVFLAARLTPTMQEMPVWSTSLTWFGAATVVVGGVLALIKTDLKQLLAYSTVTALGVMTMLLGVGSTNAMHAALAFAWAHAAYKGALFMVAGSIDKLSGSRDVEEISGLSPKMPLLTVACVLAGLSLIGVVATAGFTSKELSLKALAAEGTPGYFLVAVLVLGAVSGGGVAMITYFRALHGRAIRAPKEIKREFPSLWIGPLLLSSVGIASAFAARFWEYRFVGPALDALTAAQPDKPLQIIYEADVFLAISLLSVATAALVAWQWDKIRAFGQVATKWFRVGPQAAYEAWLAGTLSGGGTFASVVFADGLRRGVLLVAICALGLGFWTSVGGVDFSFANLDRGLAHEWFAVFGLLIGAAMACGSLNRLVAVVGLGLIGLSGTLVFASFGAPDLAITQFVVEALTVLVVVLALRRLPQICTTSGRRLRVPDMLLAGVVGAGVALVTFAAMGAPHPTPVASAQGELSYTEAFGRNVVNVILVDFRALDTLGEIFVLGIAALGCSALLHRRLRRPKESAG